MTKLKKILLCVGFSFMFLFISIGYAQLSDSLRITGEVKVHEIQAIYIKEVSISGVSNIKKGTPTVTKTGLLTFQHSDYVLKEKSGTFTITVKVKNNSGVDQYFAYHTALEEVDKLNNNTATTYTGLSKKEDRLVRQGEEKTFTFTVQNVSKNELSMKDFQSLLVFGPDFDDTVTETATYSIARIFANVLAGKGPAGDGTGIIYQGKQIAAKDVLKQITDKMTSVDTGGYTGNVGNATQAEKDLMESVFGDNIIIQLGANYYQVYLLIKNQQIDNKGDNDMVIYITADQLNVGGGQWKNNSWQNMNIVPVYGLVFIKDGNTYKFCDHLFAGEAPVCDFGGALGDGKVGNFHTNIWNSTEFKSVTDTSGGSIGQQYITTNGELDEAYQYYIKNNPNALIPLDQVK